MDHGVGIGPTWFAFKARLGYQQPAREQKWLERWGSNLRLPTSEVGILPLDDFPKIGEPRWNRTTFLGFGDP